MNVNILCAKGEIYHPCTKIITPPLHLTVSLKRNNIETFCL